MIQTHTEATNNRLCDPYQELALAIVRQAVTIVHWPEGSKPQEMRWISVTDPKR